MMTPRVIKDVNVNKKFRRIEINFTNAQFQDGNLFPGLVNFGNNDVK